MEPEPFKSPRALEEELRDYTHKRFETYMKMVDDGTIPRALAITAFQDEVDYYFWAPSDEAA